MKKVICWTLTMVIAVSMLSGCQSVSSEPDDNEIVTVYCVESAVYHKLTNGKTVHTTCTYYDTGFLKSRIREGEVTESFSYDERGNILNNKNGTRYTYDENNNVLTETSVRAGKAETVFYTYNRNGQLVKTELVRDDQVQTRDTIQYDIFGRKIYSKREYLVDEDTPNTYKHWTYDIFGNVLTEKLYYDDTLREEIEYTYYLDGKMATKKETFDGEVVLKQSCKYDLNGNLVENYSESRGIYIPEYPPTELTPCLVKNTYDSRGNLVMQTITEGDSEPYNITWTYNERGQKTSYTFSNTKTEWIYDEHGNMIEYRWYYEGELSNTIKYTYTSFEVPRWSAEIIKEQQDEYMSGASKWA